MSVVHKNADGFDDLLDSMFGSTPSTSSAPVSSSIFNQPNHQSTLGLTAFKQDKPSKEQYISKADLMEEGRMSSKVIRTQLVKGEKSENVQKKFEQAERIRLQALIGKQAQEKIKRKRNQLDSSDDGSEIEPTSKLGLVKINQMKEEERQEKYGNNKMLLKASQPALITTKPLQEEVTEIFQPADDNTKDVNDNNDNQSKKQKKKNKKIKLNAEQQLQLMHQKQLDDDELVVLEAD